MKNISILIQYSAMADLCVCHLLQKVIRNIQMQYECH